MRETRQARTGFTLIEVTIAVLVMGILAAVAAPSYVTSIARYRAEMAAKRIVADLKYAQTAAQRASQTRTVQFDTVGNSYTLVGVDDIDASANTYVVSLVDDPFRATLMSASFGADANVIFNMYGRPDTGGTIIVQSGNVQKTVSLGSDGSAEVF